MGTNARVRGPTKKEVVRLWEAGTGRELLNGPVVRIHDSGTVAGWPVPGLGSR